MERIFFALTVFLLLLGGAVFGTDAAAGESWRETFDRLCGVTDQATNFSDEELKALIADCDALIRELKTLDVPKKKLYLFRIKKCRNLFQFVLDSRKHSAGGPGMRAFVFL